MSHSTRPFFLGDGRFPTGLIGAPVVQFGVARVG
ncbi:hypothetical protein M2427_004465 [Bradyrhizobium sp. BR13661]|nr:hypothetical protein [Bradyrhizobium sp. BR13661]